MEHAYHRTKLGLTGRRATLIAVVAGLVLAPTAAYATDRVLSVIADPYDSSAMARVSGDGRLGVRGEVVTQQGLPVNEWHKGTNLPSYSSPVLIKEARPGWSIGVSQITVAHIGTHTEGWGRAVLLVSRPDASTCAPELENVESAEWAYDVYVDVPPSASGRGLINVRGSDQVVFPVPLTFPPAGKSRVCLYAAFDPSGHRVIDIDINGISGPATGYFVPPSGVDGL